MTDTFKEMDALYREARRVEAIRTIITEMNERLGKMGEYGQTSPKLFSAKDMARTRRTAIRRIKIVLREDWDG